MAKFDVAAAEQHKSRKTKVKKRVVDHFAVRFIKVTTKLGESKWVAIPKATKSFWIPKNIRQDLVVDKPIQSFAAYLVEGLK